MKNSTKQLICILGPTASGKTALAIQVAKYFKCDILSADSRQFYKELNIGVAKPSKAELSEVKHYFINSLSIHDNYSAGDFERDAIVHLEKLYQTNNIAVLVGGSGLFIKAVCEGLDDYPDVPKEVRLKLINSLKEKGLAALQQKLKELDPEYYETIDIHNSRRIIRALEVMEFSGKPFSSFQKNYKVDRSFNIVKIGIEWPREQLYNRINQRVEVMVKDGLVEEAKLLHTFANLNALQTVGYQELFDFFEHKISLDKAIELIKRNSRRYAKRQMTWLRKDDEIHWFKSEQGNKIMELIQSSQHF